MVRKVWERRWAKEKGYEGLKKKQAYQMPIQVSYIHVKPHQCVPQGYSDVSVKVITTALKYGMPGSGAHEQQ